MEWNGHRKAFAFAQRRHILRTMSLRLRELWTSMYRSMKIMADAVEIKEHVVSCNQRVGHAGIRNEVLYNQSIAGETSSHTVSMTEPRLQR